jgi:hypothetical protein
MKKALFTLDIILIMSPFICFAAWAEMQTRHFNETVKIEMKIIEARSDYTQMLLKDLREGMSELDSINKRIQSIK